MNCKYCGNKIGKGARFCRECGKSVDGVTEGEKISDSRRGKFFRTAGAIAVSACACAVLIFVSLAFSVRLGLSGDTVKSRVERMNAGTVLSSETEILSDDGGNISDFLYRCTGFSKINDGMISRSDFHGFLLETDFLEFFGEKSSEYIKYVLRGGKPEPKVTVKEIAEFFEDNSATSADMLGYRLSDSDFGTIRRTLNENNFEERFSIEGLSRETDVDLRGTSYFFQVISLMIFTALTAVLFIWTAVILDKKVIYLLEYYGNILITAGAAVFTASLAVVLSGAFGYMLTQTLEVYFFGNILMPAGLFGIATGLFEAVVGIILKLVRKLLKKRKTES